MHAPKRILVAVDFSPCSRAALKRASDLASAFGATLDLLHVWTVPVFLAPDTLVNSPGGDRAYVELAQKDAEIRTSEFMLKARADGIAVERSFARFGEAARTIVVEAEQGHYDLIAIGTHGRTGMSHLLLGSVAEKVVRLANRPVLTVRELKA
jgi:nucleotide-binding universal stress UspA family protein